MTKVHANRLRKLADHLKKGKLGHKKFRFHTYNEGGSVQNKCGTAGCAIGECPIVFPRHWKFCASSFAEDVLPILRGWADVFPQTCGEEFFGIDRPEYEHLFLPLGQAPALYGGMHLDVDATRHQVASNIYAFLKVKGF